MERRELLKIAAVAATAGRLVEAQGQHKFFTAEEFAIVDELMEIIIPADDHSPGARAAQCAAYVDARLAEEPDAAVKESWRAGIKEMDKASKSINGAPFMAATPEGRMTLLNRMDPHSVPDAISSRLTGLENFFALIKEATIHAYYTSKIGIHQEMEYKGNVLLNQFVGTQL